MPTVRSYSDERVPTLDEIHMLLEHPDRRIKTIVLVMISSGIRVGSWDFLQWKHVVPIERDNNIVAAKLVIKNTKIHNRIYYSFITPEAYFSLKDWMDFRNLHGEEINRESWFMRDTGQKIDRLAITQKFLYFGPFMQNPNNQKSYGNRNDKRIWPGYE